MGALVKLVPAWCWWLLAVLLVGGGQQYRINGLQVDLADLSAVQQGTNDKLIACRQTRSSLLVQVGEQNRAIADLSAQAELRREAAQMAQREAESRAQQADKQALSVMQERTPAGADVCAAASAAFDDELKRERGL